MKAEETLSAAEMEALMHAAYDKSAKLTAAIKHRSEHTIRTQHESIRRKLKVCTMAGAVGKAYRTGLLPYKKKRK